MVATWLNVPLLKRASVAELMMVPSIIGPPTYVGSTSFCWFNVLRFRLSTTSSADNSRSAARAFSSLPKMVCCLAKFSPIFSALNTVSSSLVRGNCLKSSRPPADIIIACWNKPLAAGVCIIACTDAPPADSPMSVTFAASPPN